MKTTFVTLFKNSVKRQLGIKTFFIVEIYLDWAKRKGKTNLSTSPRVEKGKGKRQKPSCRIYGAQKVTFLDSCLK